MKNASRNFEALEIQFRGGSRPDFGRGGIAQRWANILGNASGGSGPLRAWSRVNGNAPAPLSLGPDVARLVGHGDFNVEVDVEHLLAGINTVEVIAEDSAGVRRSSLLDFSYEPRAICPPPLLDICTDDCACIYDFGQPVDGDWKLGPDGARCLGIGYDRLLAFGDRRWSDYEIFAEVTVHGFHTAHPGYPHAMGPGVGFLTRWAGHHDDGLQPRVEWRPCGVLGWYRFGRDRADAVRNYRLCMNGGDTSAPGLSGLLAEDHSGLQIKPEVPHSFRMRVKSRKGRTSHYSLRVWPASSPEPREWNLQAEGLPCENQTGSILFVCHHADASLRRVQVRAA
ncbi:MAG: hypothetical protein WCS65_12740 [Verrucomicrobiae bacterium]